MSKMDVFCGILEDCVDFYTNMLNFENSKYDTIVEKDVFKLEEMLKTEQVFVMKSGMLEKQRIALQDELGLGDYTLAEMADQVEPQYKSKLLGYREQLVLLLMNIKEINKKSMQMVETRLRTTEKTLEQSGYSQDAHTYTGSGTVKNTIAGESKNLITKSV